MLFTMFTSNSKSFPDSTATTRRFPTREARSFRIFPSILTPNVSKRTVVAYSPKSESSVRYRVLLWVGIIAREQREVLEGGVSGRDSAPGGKEGSGGGICLGTAERAPSGRFRRL